MHLVRSLGWTLLATSLACLLTSAFLYQRAGWPDLVAGEATCLMQAESLAFDFDLTYTRADFDRLLLRWHGDPRDLELATGSAGLRITFDRPFPYALWLAPFVAWRPESGFATANAILLALVSVLAARTLGRGSAWVPWWIACLVFASVLFAYVFLATGDLFLFAVTLAAYCLLVRGRGSEPAQKSDKSDKSDESDKSTGGVTTFAAAGALLAVPLTTDLLYGLLLAPAFFMPVGDRRRRCRQALVAGSLAMVGAVVLVQWIAGGGLRLLSTSSFRFTAETGYPLVDFTAAEWPGSVGRLTALHGDGLARVGWDAGLWLWDLVYLFLGRNIGLLPYFAPCLLFLFCGSLRGYRKAIVAAGALWVIAVVVLRPFDLAGGEGAVANRLFLPVYGMLWLLLDRRRGGVRAWLPLPIAVALAALFMGQLWQDPWADPFAEDRGLRPSGGLARQALPYETSQRWLASGPVASFDGVTVRFVSGGGWAESRHQRLWLEAASVELLIGSVEPLEAIRLEPGGGAVPRQLTIRGGKIDEERPSARESGAIRILPEGLRRRHSGWWSAQPRYLVLVRFEMPPTAPPWSFQIAAERRSGS